MKTIKSALTLTALLSSGCVPIPNTTDMTCQEIEVGISIEEAPDKYPAANIEGEYARQVRKDIRIKALKAAAYDKGCVHESSVENTNN